MSRQFTGRHMWVVAIGFFGTIFAVNFTMAWFATNSFGGTVVENSYVASQQFNGWLEAARIQERLGWQAEMTLDAERYVKLVVVSGSGSHGFAASGTAHHPLGREKDIPMVFVRGADGVLRSRNALPPGRWMARIAVQRDDQMMKLAQTLQ